MEKGKIIPKERSQHFKKWNLHAFDSPLSNPQALENQEHSENQKEPQEALTQAIHLQNIALPTAQELENLHESAYQEGKNSGFSTGLEEGKKQGYAEGFEKGKQEGHHEGFQKGLEEGQKQGHQKGFENGTKEGFQIGKEEGLKEGQEEEFQKLNAVKILLNSLENALKEVKQNIADDLLKLAVSMAQNILHKELSLPQSQLHAILQEALTNLPDNTHKIVVRLNPSDRIFLNPADFPSQTFDFIEDKSIQKGGCQIDWGDSSLDARIEKRWEKTTQSLGLNEPWEKQETPSGGKSVVSDNPALSQLLEKELLNAPSSNDNPLQIEINLPEDL